MEVILLFLVLLTLFACFGTVGLAGDRKRRTVASMPTVEVIVACGRYPTGML